MHLMANGTANKRRDVEKILESTNHINSNDNSDAEKTLHDTFQILKILLIKY